MFEVSSTTVHVSLLFEKPVYVSAYPAFVLRSVLGYQLRKMHCVARKESCDSCVFHKTCAYAFLFETILDKGNAAVPGRDRASHPFRIMAHAEPGTSIGTLDASVQLIGRGMDYVPHIIYAFREAGKEGLFRERRLFTIAVTNTNKDSLLTGETVEVHNILTETHSAGYNTQINEKRYRVQSLSPLRFRVQGHHTDTFTATEFLINCFTRAKTVCSLYGRNNSSSPENQHRIDAKTIQAHITNSTIIWKDYVRYSARQNSRLYMGGFVGSFAIQGKAPAMLWETLELCGKIGAGKNTSHGFGNILVQEE